MTERDPLQGFSASEVMETLHGFQRDAAEYAFERLWLAPDSTHRFLIADEVGLGKTHIARGILGRALEHLRDKVERIDVIYICSNLAIARQNINRLNPLRDLKFADAERITLLPVNLRKLGERRVNFVAFTPGTSLDMGNNLGMSRERMLLYTLLREHWSLSGTGPANVFQGAVTDNQRFREALRYFQDTETVSPELRAAFLAQVDAADGLRGRFEALCDSLRTFRARLPRDLRKARNALVGELRGLLARACIGALEPDLVILDEFQRFKDLLDPETEAGALAHHLFEWSDASARARVLLLSATPYKAYTLSHEHGEDDHYADFLATVRFLDHDPSKSAHLKALLEEHRQELYRAGGGDLARLPDLKNRIEAHLRRVMSRTERMAVVGVENGMLRSLVDDSLSVQPEDIRGYLRISRLAEELDVDDALEYWKSAAYPINFMEGYELKSALNARSQERRVSPGLTAAVAAARPVSLPVDDIRQFRPLTLPNARLRRFVEDLERRGAFDVLWLPPSLPHYQLGPRFAGVDSTLTKRLVFSAWQVVPRSIAALVSYEAERRAYVADDSPPVRSDGGLRLSRRTLRLDAKDGLPSGLPALTTLVPCRWLAEHCDPRLLVRGSSGDSPTLLEALQWAESRIQDALPEIVGLVPDNVPSDDAWYWVALILLDRVAYQDDSSRWWSQDDLASKWKQAEQEPQLEDPDDEASASDSGWHLHYLEARAVAEGRLGSLGSPPSDLARVLAVIAMGGAATAALRALLRLYPADRSDACRQRTAAAQIGWGFRSMFNRPEVSAVIRRPDVRGDAAESYWRQVLEYSVDGGLSAVLDEYMHVLRDASGLTNADIDNGCAGLAEKAVEALTFRTTHVVADEVTVGVEDGRVSLQPRPMRVRFAVRYGSDKTQEKKQVLRDSTISAAFNSPFWPFVLASTSVGQEGLDFHWYCHAVVHWNLPSNPVDLEQREGRVHRFKGHAVRKNVARVFGVEALQSREPDAWQTVFRLAESAAPDGSGGLIPYWLYPLQDGAWIERHVPVFPLSRDETRLHALRKALGAYRMVFGQPRQDELLAYLIRHMSEDEIQRYSELLRIDLAPPRAGS